MRIVYFDIDSLRADHLGCYGYHRDTSPTIDALAAEGVRFDQAYVSDAPCLPSRTALFSGRFGTHTGVVGHGGTAADPFVEGPSRGFGSTLGRTAFTRLLRDAGLWTCTVSPFAERHAAWHFYAAFNEVHNPGKRGLERADEIAPHAIEWIRRRGADDDWFLHVQLWDPHTPYRTPDAWGHPFANAPVPSWLTERVRAAHWQSYGPNSAQEPIDFGDLPPSYAANWPKQPRSIDGPAAVRALFDGYDEGVRYADEHIAHILDALKAAGVYDDTAILVSANHGENLGELNVYADHHTADPCTTRVPFVIRWPGITDSQPGRVDRALHYQFDLAATIATLLGRDVPDNWDGESFADALRAGSDAGRDHLVLTQGAWTCQRAVRFADWVYLRTYHDGYHPFPDHMLFDLAADPHLQTNLAPAHPDTLADAQSKLSTWHTHVMATATHPIDPLDTVLAEGGPAHTRGKLPAYLTRLRTTNRTTHATTLASRTPRGSLSTPSTP